jgi:hypothetical protein
MARYSLSDRGYDILVAPVPRWRRRYLWIDSICIDQANSAEKGHQVSIMSQIYETAENVAVYLGLPNERSEEGMRYLKFFTEPKNLPGDPP